CDAVECFFDKGFLSKGNNASFIALIPKVLDAKFVNDFRPLSLIGSVYKVITKVLATRLAGVISNLVSHTQTAFIANRQILDGPFVVNELLAWCNRKKKQALMFKVDFAEAYDSVRWDYLLDVLQAFGFGSNWCKWIRGILSSSMASILINGSPTSEFPLLCGLKQGDPLAHFLFILIMESFHNSVSKAVAEGFFRGLQIQDSVFISHLFYADDAFFIGEWSEENLLNLIKILKLTLLKSVLGATPLYTMSIYKAPKRVLQMLEIIRSKFFYGADSSKKKITWIAWEKTHRSGKEKKDIVPVKERSSDHYCCSTPPRIGRRKELSKEGSPYFEAIEICLLFSRANSLGGLSLKVSPNTQLSNQNLVVLPLPTRRLQ
nr:RNA-directed DNA polymerase, eukaryota [Tanacetum cinerariifolium]